MVTYACFAGKQSLRSVDASTLSKKANHPIWQGTHDRHKQKYFDIIIF